MQKIRKMKTSEERSWREAERRWRQVSVAFLRRRARYCCHASAAPLRSSIGGRSSRSSWLRFLGRSWRRRRGRWWIGVFIRGAFVRKRPDGEVTDAAACRGDPLQCFSAAHWHVDPGGLWGPRVSERTALHPLLLVCCGCVRSACGFFCRVEWCGFFFFWLTFKEKELWASVVDVSGAM